MRLVIEGKWVRPPVLQSVGGCSCTACAPHTVFGLDTHRRVRS